jgi:membrane protease YdiL (CAAX protease family)
LPKSRFLADLKRYFVGPRGIRFPWRLLIYVALSLSLSGLMFVGLGRFISFAGLFPEGKRGVVAPMYLLVTYGVGFLADVLSALLMSRIERRPFGAYGLPRDQAFGKLFWQGVAVGILALTELMLAIYALGGFSLGRLALSGFDILKYGAFWAATCLVVSFMENFRYRGYLQITLGAAIGFWPAAITLSMVYAARHLFDLPGQKWSGAISVFLFELLFCFVLRRTGNLWWPIGFQAAWDFGEIFLYSVPDSGYRVYGSLLNSSWNESPQWLTGGSVGPEGSLFCFVVLVILCLVIHKFYPPRVSPASGAKR